METIFLSIDNHLLIRREFIIFPISRHYEFTIKGDYLKEWLSGIIIWHSIIVLSVFLGISVFPFIYIPLITVTLFIRC